MYLYSTDNYSLLVPYRCGYLAFRNYFNDNNSSRELLKNSQTIEKWKQSDKKRILILRHPMDRLYSAIAFIEVIMDEKYYDVYLESHAAPFLHEIENIEFEIVPFENLSNYLSYNSSEIAKVIRPHLDPIPFSLIDEYMKDYTKEDYIREIEIYNTVRKTKRVACEKIFKGLN